MSIVIDIVLVVVLIIAIVVSAKRGFMITLLQLAAFALAVIFAFQLSKPVSNLMYKTVVGPSVQKSINKLLPDYDANITNTKKAEVVLESMPQFVKNYIEKAGISTDSVMTDVMSGTYKGQQMSALLSENIIKPFTIPILSTVNFLVLSALFGLILARIAKKMNDGMKQLTIAKNTNAVLGGIFGLLKGAVIDFFLCYVLMYVAERYASGDLRTAIYDSSIIRFVQSFSPITIYK